MTLSPRRLTPTMQSVNPTSAFGCAMRVKEKSQAVSAHGAPKGEFMTDTMKTYAEKLKDPRWTTFREKAFNYHRRDCQNCGQETDFSRGIQVHHLKYIKSREPWDYEMDDVMILCGFCHEDIHDAEDSMRSLVRSMPPWVAREWRNLAEMIAEQSIDPRNLMSVAVRAKRAAWEAKNSQDTESNKS